MLRKEIVGKVPHMVTPNKSRSFCCDSNCVNWKSLGICAHSVAVAEINGKLLQVPFHSGVCYSWWKDNTSCLLTRTVNRANRQELRHVITICTIATSNHLIIYFGSGRKGAPCMMSVV